MLEPCAIGPRQYVRTFPDALAVLAVRLFEGVNGENQRTSPVGAGL